MTTQTSTPTRLLGTTYTSAERQQLRVVRRHDRPDPDLFTEQERARLCLFRWLYETGRLPS